MDTILETVPSERTLRIDSILTIKDNDPISQIQHSAYAAPADDPSNAILETVKSIDGHVRRNSTGDIGIPYKSVKILSRYLAANTATCCHDQCKYGTRQYFYTNMMGSETLKTIAEKHSRGHYYTGKNVALAEGNKKSAVSFPHSGSRSHEPNTPVSAARREISPPSPKENLFKQYSLSLKGLVPKSKPTLSKLSALPTEDYSESKEMGTDRKRAIRNAKEDKTSKLICKNAPSSNRHSVNKALTRPTVSLAPKHSGEKYVRPKIDKLKSLKVVRKAEIQLSSSKKEIFIDQWSTTSTEKIEGRTQCNQRTSVLRSSTSQDDMEKRSMNAEAEKKKPKRDGKVRAKDQDSAARKLNLRKGKVIENQTVNSTSRRVKFKQRSLSDSLVVEVFKNRENHIEAANSESEKVGLKHKDDDEDKKGPQKLLNKMIEETTNKLGETKKSKVKELVGAFETAISLQDAKPAASTVDVQ